MSYRLLFSKQASDDIKKLDNSDRKLLKNWLSKHLVACEDPRAFGKALSANKKGLWRYRIGKYRLICKINDEEFIILALTCGHRSEVYK